MKIPIDLKAGMIIGVDPGPSYPEEKPCGCAIVQGGEKPSVQLTCEVAIDELATLIAAGRFPFDATLVIERVENFGAGAGASLFSTCETIGRLRQAWLSTYGSEPICLPRRTVLAHFLGSQRGGDKEIRAVLIEEFGGESIAIGGKRCDRCKGRGLLGSGKHSRRCDSCSNGLLTKPGPLHSVKGHAWPALALALAYNAGARASVSRIAKKKGRSK